MGTIIWSFVSKAFGFFKTKNGIITLMAIIIFILIGVGKFLLDQYKYQKSETERMTANFQNADFKLDSTKTKTGELQYIVNNLQLKKGELEDFNSKLVGDIKNLNIKLKNVGNVVVADPVYIFVPDTIKVEKKTDTTFIAKYEDDWVSLRQRVNLIDHKKNIRIDSLQLILHDKLLIINEVIYKRVWIFWRKPIGGKLHISSKNPYFHMERIESYDLIKK